MRSRDPDNPSLETIRQLLARTDKFEKKVALLGRRYAIQTVRPIGSLHTYYPGQRTELDYTKFGLYLYPTEHWNEPQLYFSGFGIDHCSAVCKGYTITTAPAARDAIRLYRNCVLPKSLWLPDTLKSKANAWDVFGIEEVIAIDNGMDLIADAAIMVFIYHGVIVLRIPPKRRGPQRQGRALHWRCRAAVREPLARLRQPPVHWPGRAPFASSGACQSRCEHDGGGIRRQAARLRPSSRTRRPTKIAEVAH